MKYEILVGLNVIDENLYSEYRKAMTPLLENQGGGFRYDFKIQEVLKKETENEINRVFAIYFIDKKRSETFFSDPEYKKIKDKYFEKSVKTTTILASYEIN